MRHEGFTRSAYPDPIPDLEFRPPCCSLCHEELVHDGDGWNCSTCGVNWPNDGMNGEPVLQVSWTCDRCGVGDLGHVHNAPNGHDAEGDLCCACMIALGLDTPFSFLCERTLERLGVEPTEPATEPQLSPVEMCPKCGDDATHASAPGPGEPVDEYDCTNPACGHQFRIGEIPR